VLLFNKNVFQIINILASNSGGIFEIMQFVDGRALMFLFEDGTLAKFAF
jgi:hypothetical protein